MREFSELKIAVMQPYIFPHLNYWRLMASVDRFIVFDEVFFQPRSYMVRNVFLGDLCTLSVLKPSQNTPLGLIEVENKSLEKFYNKMKVKFEKSDCWFLLETLFEKHMQAEKTNLSSLLYDSIEKVVDFLKVDTQILRSSDLPNPSGYFGKERLYNCIKIVGADIFVNNASGVHLYDGEVLESIGCRLLSFESGVEIDPATAQTIGRSILDIISEFEHSVVDRLIHESSSFHSE